MSSEKKIRWKDLGSHYLRRWKSILAVTVLCTVVLGGWQYFSVKKIHDAGEQTKEELRYTQGMADYERELAAAQENVDACVWTSENRRAYRENSILMNLNPEDVWAAEKKYRISGAEETAAVDLLAAYTGVLTADHDAAAIQEAFGMDNPGYAVELITIVSDPAECSFTVTAYAAEKEQAEKELAYVSGLIEAKEKQAQTLGAHTLKMLNEGSSKTVFYGLIDLQNALAEQIADDEDNITHAKRLLKNVQEGKPFAPRDPVVRWAVAGGVLGFLLMLAIYLTTFLRKQRAAGETK